MTRPKHQVAALPFRIGDLGPIEILLVTSRGSGHWTLPKGWPIPGRTAQDAARTEALEEAGVSGILGACSLGQFDYTKKSVGTVVHRVTVYPLKVTRVYDTWDEQDQRKRRWFTLGNAAAAVKFPRLRKILWTLRAECEPQEPLCERVERQGGSGLHVTIEHSRNRH